MNAPDIPVSRLLFFFFLAIRWIARAHNAHQNGLLLTLRCPSPASLPQAVSSRPNRIERKRMKNE